MIQRENNIKNIKSNIKNNSFQVHFKSKENKSKKK